MALHAGVGLLVMDIAVRTPQSAPPIRLSLYQPALAPSAGSVQAPPKTAVQPQAMAAEPVKPVNKPRPRLRRQPVAQVVQPVPVPAPATDTAQTQTQAVSPMAGGEAQGIAGGRAGGTGRGLIPADQAARPLIAIHEIMPEYPPVARLRGVEGQVVLEAIVAPDGRIEPEITVIHSVPLLDSAAIAAVRQWRFQPARDDDGTPLRVALRVPVRFMLR